jgi:hypothetical protein
MSQRLIQDLMNRHAEQALIGGAYISSGGAYISAGARHRRMGGALIQGGRRKPKSLEKSRAAKARYQRQLADPNSWASFLANFRRDSGLKGKDAVIEAGKIWRGAGARRRYY